MNPTLDALDREWSLTKSSPAGREALRTWARSEPALTCLRDLEAVVAQRLDPDRGPLVLAALARLAPDHVLAARTLLQALLPGLVRLAVASRDSGPQVIDELVSLAWERIRSYPTGRQGSVAANVLFDVRKRYHQSRSIERPTCGGAGWPPEPTSPSAEEIVIERSLIDELEGACRDGTIDAAGLRLILRTRIGDVPVTVVARQDHVDAARLFRRRREAERSLRHRFRQRLLEAS